MSVYVVKLRFWLRAYDSTTVSAATKAEAFYMAKLVARRMMGSTGRPDEIDTESRREGLISYIDRIDGDGPELAEAIVFDGDRPLHPEARALIERLAALDTTRMDTGQASTLLQSLIAEARQVQTDRCIPEPIDVPVEPAPWSVDRIYEYRGKAGTFVVAIVDEAGLVHALDPRLDLRNHSPTGFSWGYSGSGPAQLALAILSHALNCDERAEELYQAFKDDVVSHLDQNKSWRLTTDDVLAWVLRHSGMPDTADDD